MKGKRAFQNSGKSPALLAGSPLFLGEPFLEKMKGFLSNLLKSKKLNEHSFFVIQIIVILFWGFQLISSDAYYVNYCILIMITAVCIFKNREIGEMPFGSKHGKYVDVIINIAAILFSFMVAFANYKLWTFAALPEEYGYRFKWCYHYFMMVMLFAGGYFAFYNIFIALVRNIKCFIWSKIDNTVNPKVAFVVCFGLLLITRLIVLFCCQYPGVLTSDSVDQMGQLLNGSGYNNHHPFYHTMVIKFFVIIGMHLFNEVNAAVATYSVFQTIFTSLCFAFAVSTMARMKSPKWIVIASILFFVFMPYHIMYAITMWKDIMFGCFVLLLVTFSYRCMYEVGHRILDYIIVTMSSIGICLFRSNGFFVFIILTFAFIVLWKSNYKRMLIVFISVIIISFVMKHAVLARLGVTQPDTIEYLSVPAQQIARVVQEGCELNEWQRSLLSNVIEIESIPEKYSPYISDPIKGLVREKGNQSLLSEQKADYIKLYCLLGIKYPMVYLRAWIDQTKGYWNAGYEYSRWALGITENDLGIERTTNNIAIDLMLREYLWLFTNLQGLRMFLSIGFFVWIDILMLMVALIRKDKIGVFISLPILVVVASLLVATPVYSEFRYIYAAFCALPMVIVIALRPFEGNIEEPING